MKTFPISLEILRVCLFLIIASLACETGSLLALDVELEPITITLDKQDMDKTSLTKDTAIIRPDEEPHLSFESLLEGAAGSDLARRGISGIQSDLSIRGSTPEQATIAVNSIMLNDPQTAHHNLDLAFPETAIKKIEVSRASSTESWAQSAIGGAVNIQTKRPARTESQASFSYGTDSTNKASVYTGYKTPDAGINFAAEETSSDGWRFDTDFKEFSASSSVLFEPTDMISSCLFTGYGEKEFGAANFYGPYNSKEWTDTFFTNWTTDIKINGFRISPNLYYRRHHDKYMLDIARPDYYLNHHRTITKGMQTEAEAGLGGFGSVIAGVDINEEGIKSTRLGKDSRRRNSYYISWKNYNNEIFGFDSSVRLDDYSQYHSEFLPQAGIFLRLSRYVKLTAQAAKSARQPNYTELFYNSPSNKGNKDLSPEKARNYEAGADIILGEAGKIKVSCTLFRRDSYDLIDWVKNDRTSSFYRAENITKVKTEGVEVKAGINACRWLEITGSYSYIDSDIRKGEEYISKYALNHPDHKIYSQADIMLPFGKQSIRFLYKNRKSYSSYILAGSTFNYELNKHTSLFLTVDNWFNTVYWDIRGNTLPGRQVMAGACLKF